MNKSQIFTAYNKARTAARKGATSSAGSLEVGRVNRALGVLQMSTPRPYHTTCRECDCPDRQRHPAIICKHMAACQIEYRAQNPK